MDKVFSRVVLIQGLLFLAVNVLLAAPGKMSRQEYIDKFARLAVQEMIDFHIPASITMAQACLESSDGNSELTRQSNNHFGIKCKNTWTGPSVRHNDEEANECFRKYSNPEESFRDHSSFIKGSPRYSFLFNYDIRDFKRWAHGLRQAGYATDPAYPAKLIKIIEDFRLYELDQLDWKYVKSPEKRHSIFGFLRKKPAGQNLQVASGYKLRPIEKRNRRKAFTAIEGDDYARIAEEVGKKDWQIYKYNDARSGDVPGVGEPVYLQTKRAKAPRGNDFHQVQQGETLRSIAQWYGVRLQSLRRMNNLPEPSEVVPGMQLSLRKRVK
jgi:hypothetical protein